MKWLWGENISYLFTICLPVSFTHTFPSAFLLHTNIPLLFFPLSVTSAATPQWHSQSTSSPPSQDPGSWWHLLTANSSRRCTEWLILSFLNNERRHHFLSYHYFLIQYELRASDYMKCAKFLYLKLFCLFSTAATFSVFLKLWIDNYIISIIFV